MIGVQSGVLAGGAAIAMLLPLSAGAADNGGTNLAAEAAQTGFGQTAVSRVHAATVLADLGRETSDPMLLVVAARALMAVGESPAEGTVGEPEAAGEGKPASGPGEKPEGSVSGNAPERLLQEARRMARGNEIVLAMIEDTEAGALRGSVIKGPRAYKFNLDALHRRDIAERFRGNELAEVAVIGDEDTDVDLYVYDQNGNEICRSTGPTDREYCRWTPAWTGEFTVRVRNYGNVSNQVTVVTN